jgi:copper chaperone CopZ
MKFPTTALLASTIAFGLVGCDVQNDASPRAATDTGEVAPTPTDTSQVVPVSTKTFVYSVKGMSCGGCASAVDTKVNKVDGVMACDVSLEEQKATVELADGSSATDVEEAIRSLGYTVEPESTNPAS